MTINNGGPAFPPNAGWRDDDKNFRGMSLRDYFAAKALEGILISDLMTKTAINLSENYKGTVQEIISTMAYQFAHAMIREREKKD